MTGRARAHTKCIANGGGERVEWVTVAATGSSQLREPPALTTAHSGMSRFHVLWAGQNRALYERLEFPIGGCVCV